MLDDKELTNVTQHPQPRTEEMNKQAATCHL